MLFRKILGWPLIAFGLIYALDSVGTAMQWRAQVFVGGHPDPATTQIIVDGLVGVALIVGGVLLLKSAEGRGWRLALAILGWGSLVVGLIIVGAAIYDRDALAPVVAVPLLVIGVLLLWVGARSRTAAVPLPPPP